jgi:hypothetical protein
MFTLNQLKTFSNKPVARALGAGLAVFASTYFLYSVYKNAQRKQQQQLADIRARARRSVEEASRREKAAETKAKLAEHKRLWAQHCQRKKAETKQIFRRLFRAELRDQLSTIQGLKSTLQRVFSELVGYEVPAPKTGISLKAFFQGQKTISVRGGGTIAFDPNTSSIVRKGAKEQGKAKEHSEKLVVPSGSRYTPLAKISNNDNDTTESDKTQGEEAKQKDDGFTLVPKPRVNIDYKIGFQIKDGQNVSGFQSYLTGKLNSIYASLPAGSYLHPTTMDLPPNLPYMSPLGTNQVGFLEKRIPSWLNKEAPYNVKFAIAEQVVKGNFAPIFHTPRAAHLTKSEFSGLLRFAELHGVPRIRSVGKGFPIKVREGAFNGVPLTVTTHMLTAFKETQLFEGLLCKPRVDDYDEQYIKRDFIEALKNPPQKWDIHVRWRPIYEDTKLYYGGSIVYVSKTDNSQLESLHMVGDWFTPKSAVIAAARNRANMDRFRPSLQPFNEIDLIATDDKTVFDLI